MSNSKLLIYYKPAAEAAPDIISVTLSFSRLNGADNTYKQKLIVQKRMPDGEIKKFKLKEFHVGVDKIIDKINVIDFSRDYGKVKDENEEVFCIRFEDNTIYTSDKEKIKYILSLFDFLNVIDIPVEHYSEIKNMYEYIELRKILEKKLNCLSDIERFVIENLFERDPNEVFEHIDQLNYLAESLRRK